MDEINIIINYQAGIFSILSLGLMIAMEYAYYNNLKSFTISDSFNISKFISDENNYEVHFPNDLFNNYLDITHIYRINYELARETIKKFKLKQEIIDIALDFKNKFDINENTLGLHIRLTDMNVLHTYSKLTLDDYIKKINQVLEENSVSFKWHKSDVILVDNRFVLHSRKTFVPPRRILAALFE
jgi:hypothetical protein